MMEKKVLRRYRIRDYDFKLVLMVIAVTVIGILAIGSAKESVQDKQILGFACGIVLMIIVSLLDYSFLLKFYWLYYVLNIILLVLVEVLGKKAGGAQRWVNILGIQFQPSETAKILLILFFAQFIMKNREKLNTFKILSACMVLVIIPWILILEQPDLSTSIMVAIIFAMIIFVGGIHYKIIIGFFAVTVPSAIIFISLALQPNMNLLEDYQRTRILAWLNPTGYENAEGYQQANSIMAIGSGQLWGKGLNNNIIGSVKNGNFISEPQTDFIFAIIGEELGFVGSVTIILLVFFIALECILIGKRSKDLAGTIICTGVATIVGFQSFINISVAIGILPNTGIPLPFVSYGLTSLISMYIGMGFVLNIRLQGKR